MKSRPRLSLLVAAGTALLGVLPTGCATAPTASAPAPATMVVAPLVPAQTSASLRALIARHPAARPYLVTVANALQSIAIADARLPDPNSASLSLLSWCALIPEVGSYVGDFLTIYRGAYPTLSKSGGALSEIAEIIRASA